MMRAAALGAIACLVAAAPAGGAPIPPGPGTDRVQAFEGKAWKPRPLRSPRVPRHPFMAPNGAGNLHVDGFQSDANRGPGPLGRALRVRSSLQGADCGSVTFDSRGRIVTVCVGLQGPVYTILDPDRLDLVAALALPPRQSTGGNVFQDFAGGGYFYLDHRDRAVIPTTTRHVWVVRDGALVRDYDLTSAVPPGDKIISALPDWSGRVWFVSTGGVVGTLDRKTGAVRSRTTGEGIANSFAVDDSGGVYIVTNAALYRFDAAAGGAPNLTWRIRYRNDGAQKPGQVAPGSGTTPTVFGRGGRWLAITDNADPMHVLVYRGAPRVKGRRLVCRMAVFRPGASATDQSLIAVGRSLGVENNYGYSGPGATSDGKSTRPGLERIDAGRCRRVWRSREVAPSVVPKVSLSTGLLYTYTKPRRSDGIDAWYLTAIDFRTGRTVYRRLAGTGGSFNNNYAPVTLGPDGSAYVGVLGGLVKFSDGG